MTRALSLSGLALTFLATSAYPQQYNCDCTRIVSACEASIKVEPTGALGSYGAKLTFTSTAPICSKVSYYVDSTPYFNILSRGNTDQDSVFGTKPVTRDTISDIKCQVCQQMSAVRPQVGTASDSSSVGPDARQGTAISPFQGSWRGAWRWLFVSGTIDVTIDVVGDKATGTASDEGGAGPFEGTINGPLITGTYARGDGRRGRLTIQLLDEHTVKWTAHNPDGRTVAAELKRQY